jgi:hypothetical protein
MLLGAGAWIFFAGANAEAEPGDRTGPPETHRLVSVSVPGDAAWLFSIKPFARMKSASLVALTKEGRFFSLEVKDGRLRAKPLPALATLSPGVPPATLDEGIIAGATRNGSFRVIDFFRETVSTTVPSKALSPLSRLAALTKSAATAVGRDGSLMIFQKFGGKWKETQRLPAQEAKALPDALLAAADLDGDGARELIVPAAPTGRYAHGVLGDAIEPSEIRVFKMMGGKIVGGRLSLLSTYRAEGDGVFEAIGALGGDLDGDGRAEILVTRSDYGSGAGHMALALRKGRLIQKAKGATIGLGNRWSHLLGAFDMGAGGISILAIETPHLAGYLLALEMKGGRLAERARRPGFTTHSIGSRNVWEFAVIRRAGAAEIVVQEVGRGRLAALALRKNRWVIRWTIPLAGPVQSNIVGADLNGDGLDDLAFAGPGGKVHALLSR